MKDTSKLKQGDKIVIIMDGEYIFKYTVGQVYKFVKEQDGYIRVSVDGLEETYGHTTLLGDHEWDFFVEPEEIHQWKLGEVVMIASSSEYYKNPGSELNPRDISGIISHIDNDDDHAIEVKWSNGKTNSYRPKDLVEFMDQTIVSYDRFNVGDKLPRDIVNDWTNSGCNEYTDGNKEWRKSVSRYNYDISISLIVRHEDGEIAFKLRYCNFYIRAKGFRNFMDAKTTDVPVVVPPPTPIAKFPYVVGEWIECCNSIIRIDSVSPTHITGKPWILSKEMMVVSGTWDLKDPMLINAKQVDVLDERIQKALPGDSVYKKTYYPPPHVALAASSRFVVGQLVIATCDTPWCKKGTIGRINTIRDWNVFTLSIFKNGKFDDRNWTALNDQFTEYNENIHIHPGTAPEAFTVYTSENWSTPVDKSSVKIVELEFQSPVLLKKKTKKNKLIIINN